MQKGTYTGNVQITQSLTLAGPNANSTGYGTRVGEAVIQPGTDEHLMGNLIYIQASDVTIEGLTLDGSNSALRNAGAPRADGTIPRPAMASATPSTSLPSDTPATAYAVSNTTITDNIVENFAQSGILWR